MKSICTSLEAKLLEVLRGIGLGIDIEGLFEVAASGTVKQEELTALQVRVYGMTQLSEALPMYSVTAELRLNVEQAESANGQLYFDAHEKVALLLQRLMLDDNCTVLGTDEVHVDGLQVTGGDADFDAGGEWFAVWTVTLTGRLKANTEVK